MKRFSITLFLACALLAAGATHARQYKCACHVDQIEAVQTLPGDNHSCADSETFKNYKDDVSVQEKYLKLKVTKKNLTQDDGDLDFQLRPRDGYCLYAVKDVGGDKAIASSSGNVGSCDAGKWLTMKNLSLHKKDATEIKDWTGTFWASPSVFSKSDLQYYGRVYYIQGDDGKRYLAAACLQDH